MGWWGEDGGYYDDIFERDAANNRYRQNEKRNKLLEEQNNLLKRTEEHWREEEFNRKLEEERKEREIQDEITRPKRVEVAIKLDNCRNNLIKAGINHNYVKKIFTYNERDVKFNKREKAEFEKKELEIEELSKKKILINGRLGVTILVLCGLISTFLILMTVCGGSKGTLTIALYSLVFGLTVEAYSSFSYKRKLKYNEIIDKKIQKIESEIAAEEREIDKKVKMCNSYIVDIYNQERIKIYNSEIELLLRNYEKNLKREVIYFDYKARIINHPYIFNTDPIIKNKHLGNPDDYNKMFKKIINKISELERR